MRKLDNKVEFVNVNLTINVRLYNKEAVKRALETLAIWGAIGEYEKKDAFRQIDEVG
jgi:hypothetical protein